MSILAPLIAYLMIYRHRMRDTEIRREFIAASKEKEYTVKDDVMQRLRSRDLWAS